MTNEMNLTGRGALTDSEVRASVAASRARVEARAEAESNLTMGQKVGRTALALTVAGALAFTVGKAAKQGAEAIYDKFFAGPQLARTLQEPIGEVKADLKSGEIDRADVAVVTVHDTEPAWRAASELTGSDHPVQPVADIIQAQQGDQVAPGNKVVLPTDLIEPQKPAP